MAIIREAGIDSEEAAGGIASEALSGRSDVSSLLIALSFS